MSNNLLSENRAVYETMWKNTPEQDSPQMTTQYGASAMHAGYLRLQTHILIIRNIYWFSTATMVTLTHINVTLYLPCLSCS